jgi:transcriptional activator of cad operon
MTENQHEIDFQQSFNVGQYTVVPEHHYIELNKQKIELEPLAMSTLIYLAKHQGEVVTREKLLATLWPRKVVSQGALTRIIRILRMALNDNVNNPKYIKTIPKQGYCLFAPISNIQKDSSVIRKSSYRAISIAALCLFSAAIFAFLKHQNTNYSNSYSFSSLTGVSSLPGTERLPIMSNDKSQIIFNFRAKQENFDTLMIQNLNNQTTSILQKTKANYQDLAWSPNQQYIAYVTQKNGTCFIELATLTSDKKSLIDITRIEQCGAFFTTEIVFSNDSQTLYTLAIKEMGGYIISAYNINQNTYTPLLNKLNKQIYAAHLTTTDKLGKLAFIESSSFSDPAHAILFSIPSEKMYKFTHFPSMPNQFAWVNARHAFIVWIKKQYFMLNMNGSMLEVNNTSDFELHELSVANDGSLLFSSDSQSHFVEEHNNPLISGGSEVLRVAESSLIDGAAAYSNQGNRIAMLSDRRRKGIEIWLIDKIPTLLSSDALDIQYGPIKWSPDDKHLMVLTKQQRLASINIATKQVTYLTEDGEIVLAGSWGTTSDTVYFSKLVGETFQLFSLHLPDNSVSQLTTNGGYFAQISRDEKELYYTKRNETGLWKMNTRTKEHELISTVFGSRNYSRWQLVDNGIYYRHHKTYGEGIIFFDIENQSHKLLLDDINIWMFHVSNTQQKILLTRVEQQSDILSLSIVTEEDHD